MEQRSLAEGVGAVEDVGQADEADCRDDDEEAACQAEDEGKDIANTMHSTLVYYGPGRVSL